MTSKLALAYSLAITTLLFGLAVGGSGLAQYEGGYLWLTLTIGCPFLLGSVLTLLINEF